MPEEAAHIAPSTQTLTPEEAESYYFKINPAPPSLQEHHELAKEFIDRHVQTGRRLVLVTSGGTTVPLETQTVRFVDNFSAGTRGATSAEYFLQEGYAVIFLHRQFSLLPYSRHFSHSTNCFLDFMDEGSSSSTASSSSGGNNNNNNDNDHGPIIVRSEYQNEMRKVLRQYRYAKENNLLLVLPFVTVTEYLYELRSLANLMKPLGPNALFYLAAAVSDFFIPTDRMVEHKIQSSNEPVANKEKKDQSKIDSGISPDSIYTGFNDPKPPTHGKKLIIDLDPVPKFLHRLVDGWAPVGSMVVSFKLETDPDLLISKSEQALQRYSHHLVIGNLLSTRKWEVVFVSRDKATGKFGLKWVRVPKSSTRMRKGSMAASGGGTHLQPDVEIESLIIPELKKAHSEMIQGPQSTQEAK
ncbi:hypothetical protein FQN49_005422 [Arthroderma sp. PD_2]|nr:hypothetical protein FQN49_005422 [Arthroderma sp. PD_2]